MSPLRLFRAEIRKLTTTRMPLAFLAVLAGVGAINASLVRWGTDFDGSKAFISTGADQQSHRVRHDQTHETDDAGHAHGRCGG